MGSSLTALNILSVEHNHRLDQLHYKKKTANKVCKSGASFYII